MQIINVLAAVARFIIVAEMLLLGLFPIDPGLLLMSKSSSGDEIPERDVTYLLSVYLFTTELRHTCTSGIFFE